jgi:hypothetical protein
MTREGKQARRVRHIPSYPMWLYFSAVDRNVFFRALFPCAVLAGAPHEFLGEMIPTQTPVAVRSGISVRYGAVSGASVLFAAHYVSKPTGCGQSSAESPRIALSHYWLQPKPESRPVSPRIDEN